MIAHNTPANNTNDNTQSQKHSSTIRITTSGHEIIRTNSTSISQSYLALFTGKS